MNQGPRTARAARGPSRAAAIILPVLAALAAATRGEPPGDGFVPLFAVDGVPEGWTVRRWDDVGKPAAADAVWTVERGVLCGSQARGTWLMSERAYGDFDLTFEFKLGPRGNSGLALRAPMYGDPAFDGLELQMADIRYNPEAADSELTGGLYRAVAPDRQVYKPEAWNRYEISLRGSRLRAVLNGVAIHDLDLDRQDQRVKRHNGAEAPPVKDRPRRGHLGFQELSRGDERVRIRNARIRELP